jgi:hypothetical protein
LTALAVCPKWAADQDVAVGGLEKKQSSLMVSPPCPISGGFVHDK